MALSSSPAKNVVATMAINNTDLKLEMVDADFEIEVRKELTVTGSIETEFNYIPTYMNQILRNINSEEITFHKSDRRFYITGDDNFQTIIMGVDKAVTK